MNTHRILTAKPEDYGAIASVFSSATAASIQSEGAMLETLPQAIEDGEVLLSLDKRSVDAFCLYRRDLAESLFPKSKSYGKVMGLLDELGIGEEETFLIAGLYVDLAKQRRGIGTELLSSFLRAKKGASFLVALSPSEMDVASFFAKFGFINTYQSYGVEAKEKPTILIKRYRPLGLCREGVL